MNNEDKYLDDLSQIRNMMEKSTRFLSLSGLSGIFVGVVALIGAGVAHYFHQEMLDSRGATDLYRDSSRDLSLIFALKLKLILLAVSVFFIALIGGYFFTAQKAKKQSQVLWTKASKDLLINLFVPLATGGLFAIALISHESYQYVAASLLIFYGLSLFGSSKYTFDDIRWLGICEIALGIFDLFFNGHSLLIWAIGFGFLHIIYGVSMYLKYDFKK